MRKFLLVGLAGVCVLGLVGFGWLRYISRDARRWDSAQVTVTFHREPTKCSVAPRAAVDARTMPCGGVADYCRDVLKLPAGAKYLVRDMGNSHHAAIDELRSKLNEQGYRSVGVIAAVIVEPANDR
jgi:hypothetical protein